MMRWGILLARAVRFDLWPLGRAAAHSAAARTVTRADFDKLQLGMTHEEASHMLGSPGTVVFAAEPPGTPTAVYWWQNKDGSILIPAV